MLLKKIMESNSTRSYYHHKIKDILTSITLSFLKYGFLNLIEINVQRFQLENQYEILSKDFNLYLALIGYCLEFHRIYYYQQYKLKKIKNYTINLISYCFKQNFLNLIIKRIESLLNKRASQIEWHSIAICINVYKEIIRNLYILCYYSTNKVDNYIKDIFYDRQHINIFLNLIKRYKPAYNNRLHLRNLIHGIYYSTKLLNHISKYDTLMVLEKRRKKIKKKKKKINHQIEIKQQKEEEEEEEKVISKPTQEEPQAQAHQKKMVVNMRRMKLILYSYVSLYLKLIKK